MTGSTENQSTELSDVKQALCTIGKSDLCDYLSRLGGRLFESNRSLRSKHSIINEIVERLGGNGITYTPHIDPSTYRLPIIDRNGNLMIERPLTGPQAEIVISTCIDRRDLDMMCKRFKIRFAIGMPDNKRYIDRLTKSDVITILRDWLMSTPLSRGEVDNYIDGVITDRTRML